MAINRRIIFETISLRSINYQNRAPLRNLCQALENNPGVSTYITELELFDLSHDLLAESLPSIPTPSHLLFLSFLSFIPEMHNLRRLCFDKMWFREDTSINFCSDFSVLEESSVTHLTLINCDFFHLSIERVPWALEGYGAYGYLL